MRFLISVMSSLMSRPKTEAVPEVGGRSPVRHEIAVVFPAPLWPRRQ